MPANVCGHEGFYDINYIKDIKLVITCYINFLFNLLLLKEKK